MSQIGAIIMPLVPGQGLNQGFAVYNTSVLLSALCQCIGVAIASRRKVPLMRTAAWLTSAYLGGIGLMGLVIWGALTNRMPVFFIDGQGGTLLRSLAVSAAVALYLLTAGLLWRMHRRSPSPFLFWYALGLALLATGLAGSMVIAVRDSPLQWVTRSTQVFGVVYMCIAALASARKTGVWQVPGEFALRKQAEDSLRESEEKYRRLIDTANEGIMMGGLDGRITFANKKISDMLGYSIDELVGKIGLDFMPDDQREKVIAARTELTKKNSIQIEVCFIRKDGSRLWVIGSYAPITDHTGKHTGNLAMYTDITERKKVEEALATELAATSHLQKIGARFVSAGELGDVLGEIVDAAIAITHADMGNIQLLDQQSGCLRIAAYRGFEEPFLNFWNTVAEGQGNCGTAMKNARRSIVEDIAQSDIFVGTPSLKVQLDAGVRAVQSTPLVGHSGTLVGMLSTHWRVPHRPDERDLHMLDLLVLEAVDIIELSRGDEALRVSEEKYRRIVETSGEGIIIGATDGKMAFVNQKMADMLGYPKEEVVGKVGTDFMDQEQKTLVLKTRQELDKGEVTGREFKFRRKDGTALWTLCSVSPLFDDAGHHAGNLAMHTDITERKKTEEALRISEERYHNLFSTMEEGFCIIEMIFDNKGRPADYRFLEINAAFEKQTGMHEAEGKLMRELAPSHEAYWFEMYGNVALTGEPARFVNEAKALNRWFEVYAYRIGRPEERHVAIVFNDISESKRTEAALRESEERFRSSMDNMLEGCQILDRQWRYVYINDAAERQNRRPRAELIGKRYMDMWPGIESRHVFEVIRRCLEEGKAETFENEFTFPDGNIGWFDLTIQPVPEGVFILSMDVTVRRRADAALLDAKTQKQAAWYSRTLIEVSLDPLVTISAEGKITDVNEATVQATGVPRESLVGTDFSGYFTEPQKADLGYRRVFERGSVTDYPLTIRHKNGSLMDVLYNASVYKDEGGKVLGVFAAARDVTARKRIEEELAVHRKHLEDIVAARTAELQAANQDLRSSRRAALNLLKDAMEARRAVELAEENLRRSAEDLARSNKDLEQFAYVASHDLQEPLRAVGGFMGLLKNQYSDKLDDQAREYIDFSVDGAERMQSLIEGLLTFSRVGTRGGEFSSVNIKDALDGALANLRRLIEESRAVVTSDTLPVVTVDRVQMTQLLQNLVANAVKFHGPLSPEIHVGAQRKEHAWEIYVRDNGIGIDPQYFDRIFLIFQRLHTRTQYKGTGIGLAVCKKIAERHGGRIWVESVPGDGSTFYFTIPDKGESA